MKRSVSIAMGIIAATAIIAGVVLAVVLVNNQDLSRSIGGLQVLLIVAGFVCVASIPGSKLLASDRKMRATCKHPVECRVQIGVKTIQYGSGPEETMPWHKCGVCGKQLN